MTLTPRACFSYGQTLGTTLNKTDYSSNRQLHRETEELFWYWRTSCVRRNRPVFVLHQAPFTHSHSLRSVTPWFYWMFVLSNQLLTCPWLQLTSPRPFTQFSRRIGLPDTKCLLSIHMPLPKLRICGGNNRRSSANIREMEKLTLFWLTEAWWFWDVSLQEICFSSSSDSRQNNSS